MSLIYFALNRLESKSVKGNEKGSSLVSERARADEYLLNTRKSSMPLWVIVLIVLSLIGVAIGWILTSQLKEIKQLKEQQSFAETKNLPLAQVAQTKPLDVHNTHNESPKVAAFEPLTTAQIEQVRATTNSSNSSLNNSNINNLHSVNSNKKVMDSELSASSLVGSNALGKQELKVEDQKKEVSTIEEKKIEQAPEKMIVQNNPTSRIEIKIESNRNDSNKNLAKNIRGKQEVVIQKSQEDINAREVAGLILSIKSAIKNEKLIEADQMLAKLKGYLEPESITLLHLQAWRQMHGGDQDNAKAIYQQIIMRNPDDETAAINLALMHWKSGNQAEASRVIEAIAERRPNSEAIQNYRRQFGVKK